MSDKGEAKAKEKILGLAAIFFVLIIVFTLDYFTKRDMPTQSSYDYNTYTEPVPKQSTPQEPYFVHDGPIDFEKLKRGENVTLCKGKRACFGIYDKYLKITIEAIGAPTETIHFDNFDNQETYGDFASGWLLPDGWELILISQHNNTGYWKDRGKHPEVILMARSPF